MHGMCMRHVMTGAPLLSPVALSLMMEISKSSPYWPSNAVNEASSLPLCICTEKTARMRIVTRVFTVAV